MGDFDPEPPRLKDDSVASLLYVLLCDGVVSSKALERAISDVCGASGALAVSRDAIWESRAFELAGQLPWYGGG